MNDSTYQDYDRLRQAFRHGQLSERFSSHLNGLFIFAAGAASGILVMALLTWHWLHG